jgi:hypothetical protein
MTLSSYSGVGSTTPPDGLCWIDLKPVPADRCGLIPALCSDTCRDEWVHTYNPTPATHTAGADSWEPAPPASSPAPCPPPAAPNGTTWLKGLARRAL